MFWAINKTIYDQLKEQGYSELECKKRSVYNNAEVLKNFQKEKIKDIKWVDCSGIQTMNTEFKPVFYTSSHDRYDPNNHEYIFVQAHFKLAKGEVITYRDKDDKHTTAQHILAGILINKIPFTVYYRDIPINIADLDLKIYNRTQEHILEKGFISKELGVNRQADLLFEVTKSNLTIGKGLVFEIRNTESRKSIEAKSKDWINAGYSLISIDIDRFDFKNYCFKKDKDILVYRLFEDIDFILNALQKMRDNYVFLDNFSEKCDDIERRNYLMKNGDHNYKFVEAEYVQNIILYIIKINKKEKYVDISALDYMNKKIIIRIWTNQLEKLNFSNWKLFNFQKFYVKKYMEHIFLSSNKNSIIEEIKLRDVDGSMD